VRLSTGTTFAAPGGPAFSASGAGLGFATTRTLAGDVTGEGAADLVTVARSGATGLSVWVQEPGMSAVQWQDLTSGGWSFAGSRQYLADTDADGALDLISVHRSSSTGLLVWRHVSNATNAFAAPDNIADLRSRGWNWSLSREGVADTIGVIVV
jgi:acyl CoA:acetate/3-ketoacid CoA transferase alpha subunit